MDNPLTPSKIKRLIHIAEDKSYTARTRRVEEESEAVKRVQADYQFTMNCESSSGLLDLDQVEGFGESQIGTESLCLSAAAFNPGEMTGRSTGADEITNNSMPLGRHSIALASLTSEMDKQTHEVQDLIRHSICNTTNYSFHSKRDLTADEASLVMREAPLPIVSTTQTYFADSVTNNSNLSVGAYFQNRCPDFGKILQKTDSPDRSAYLPKSSISEVSSLPPKEQIYAQMQQNYKIDESLDSVPVRQSRLEKIPEKLNINNPGAGKNYEKHSFHSTASKIEKNNDTYSKDQYPSICKPESLKQIPMVLNPLASSSFASFHQSKPTDLLIRQMNASLRFTTNDTEEGSACPSDTSMSISKIADFLGKESSVSVSAMLKYNNHKKHNVKHQHMTEHHFNMQDKKLNEQTQVTNLREARKAETASSAGTLSTIISVDNLKLPQENIPSVVVTNYCKDDLDDCKGRKQSTRSKSPSSKSQSTLSTVHEICTSFKSGDSPIHTSKEQWAEIVASPANGYVGVSCPLNVSITTLTDSWLTAKLSFDNLPNDGKDLTIEMPRLPLLLSPGKSEQFTLHITSNIEMDTKLSYTIFLKDASIDEDIEQKGTIEVKIKIPMIQAMSCDGVNKVTFAPVQETASVVKSFVLLSDCPVDLKLVLSLIEGDNIFTIKNVQEIKRSDVNKVLTERETCVDEGQSGKAKSKGLNKQLCRLSSCNAIKVIIKFNAPTLSEIEIEESIVNFTGALNVNLIGVDTVLRRVELVGTVGTAKLMIKSTESKLHLSNEPTNVCVCNMGSVTGVWAAKFANTTTENIVFKVAPSKFDVHPGSFKNIGLCYTGPEDMTNEATLIFQDTVTGQKTTIQVTAGSEMPKAFPIRTSYNVMSFVRSGRKEISLKNSTNKKFHLRCFVDGEGFSIDLPGLESKGVYCMPFAGNECRTLTIMFNPASNVPHSANLHLVYDKNSALSRTVRLYGCASGDSMRWSGLVTYGETALVRAVSRESIALELFNKCPIPAFVCAKAHFNLKYNAVSATARLVGGNRVVKGRSRHSLTLLVDWARVERRARDADTAALATITVLTGAEITRRRILKVLRDESNGVLDTSLLDDHLKVLAGQFEGEDPDMDQTINDFKENKASLNELIGGLHELTAQIVLPQDFADENTIIIADDTVVEHHTLCD